jgi:multicomponent Na+:H+ antiporter subunit G
VNLDLAASILAVFLAVAGGFFLVVAGVGVMRLPDVYCRSHALGKAMTLGIICLLLSMGLAIPGLAWWKVLAAVFFQLVTVPVASHLFCLVAYHRKLRRWSAQGWIQPVE